jgi:DNA-binding CsgD family transcriptional regulator
VRSVSSKTPSREALLRQLTLAVRRRGSSTRRHRPRRGVRRGNSRGEARQLLREGIELAHRCGATALIERANDELAATGAHRRTVLLSGLDELTASERRVAQMAAEDLSNKEIAQALFVTVKTIEQHLSRVYRKLDLSSRRQLAGALGASAESAVPA